MLRLVFLDSIGNLGDKVQCFFDVPSLFKFQHVCISDEIEIVVERCILAIFIFNSCQVGLFNCLSFCVVDTQNFPILACNCLPKQ